MSRLLDIFEKERLNDYTDQYINKYEENKDDYEEYLNEFDQVDMHDVIDAIIENNDYDFLKEKLLNIKKEYLYKSYGHGLSHNEKVMLFCLYLARKENVPEEYMNLLLDAAAYHDIGRIHDFEDETHGKRSALGVSKIIRYSSNEKQDILKFIIHAHSLSDKKLFDIMNEYQNISVNSVSISIKLAKILKDADALDRARLDEEDRLNPKYLRTKTSKTMLKFAHQINECYYSNVYSKFRI